MGGIQDYSAPYRASSEQVLSVLKNPYSVWKNYNVHQKQRFFSFVFEGNLYFSKNEGYRTPKYALPLRVFEQISSVDTVEVEMGGIEPPSA